MRTEIVRKLLNKYELEPEHAEQVKKLSLIIFDKTRELVHNLSENKRELLEAAALLHDIGYYISAKGHNKNSYKLIMQEEFVGYTIPEKEIIANVARYHRGKLPKDKHSCYKDLSKEDKFYVRQLSAILRLADALDRTHSNIVKDIEFVPDTCSSTLKVILKLATPNCSFELAKANDKKDLFEQEFAVHLDFRIK